MPGENVTSRRPPNYTPPSPPPPTRRPPPPPSNRASSPPPVPSRAGRPALSSGNGPSQQPTPPNRTPPPPPPPRNRNAPSQPASQPVVPLTAEQKREYLLLKRGVVARKIGQVKNWTLTQDQRDNPDAEATTHADRFDTFHSWFGASMMDTGVQGVDAAASYVDYATGGKSRGWDLVSKESEKWGDGEMQSEGIPIFSAVAKSIDCIFKAAEYIKSMVEFAKANKNAEETTSEEKWQVFQETADMALTLLDTALSWSGAFTTVMGRLPIVGAVFGAVGAGMSFVMDCIQLHKARVAIEQMRVQKKTAKAEAVRTRGDLAGLNGTTTTELGRNGQQTTRDLAFGQTVTRTHRFHPNEQKQKVNRTFEKVRDAGTGKERDMRLDEKTQQLRSGQDPLTSSQETAVRALEDYDVTKELTQANIKRRNEGIVNLILKDAVGFGTSLATLDPTGLGAGIGASVNALVGAGFFTKKIVTSVRQKGRNEGRSGFNINKSDANKKQRRHNLAVVMFDRIKELAQYNYDMIPVSKVEQSGQAGGTPMTAQEADNVRQGLVPFKTMEERVSAMGVGGPLIRADNPVDMVKIMRQGFYRDND